MPGKGIEYALLQKSIDLTTFVKRLHRIATEKERRNDTCLLLTEICYNSKKSKFKEWFGKATCSNTPILHGANSESR